MKKLLFTVFAAVLFMASAYSYNPPAGGEDFMQLASPANLSGAKSVTGGALFDAGADSLLVNPALTASEQRVSLNAGYTFFYSSNAFNSKQIASSFQTGILIPFKLFIFNGYINGTFVPFEEMNLGSSLNFKASLSKEISDKLSVGLGAGGGFSWGGEASWALYADIGALYKWGDLGILKDFRIAGSLLNLGKMYSNARVGLDGTYNSTPYPTLVTLKAGAAGTILDTDIAKIGLGLDFTVPCFQNFIVDMNAQVAFKNAFFISIGEKFNMAELIKGRYNLIPSVGFIFKFSFDVKNNQYLEDNGWSQSEMTVAAGYKNLYKTVHAVSAGVDIDLGMADDEPPQITVWDEKE